MSFVIGAFAFIGALCTLFLAYAFFAALIEVIKENSQKSHADLMGEKIRNGFKSDVTLTTFAHEQPTK